MFYGLTSHWTTEPRRLWQSTYIKLSRTFSQVQGVKPLRLTSRQTLLSKVKRDGIRTSSSNIEYSNPRLHTERRVLRQTPTKASAKPLPPARNRDYLHLEIASDSLSPISPRRDCFHTPGNDSDTNFCATTPFFRGNYQSSELSQSSALSTYQSGYSVILM